MSFPSILPYQHPLFSEFSLNHTLLVGHDLNRILSCEPCRLAATMAPTEGTVASARKSTKLQIVKGPGQVLPREHDGETLQRARRAAGVTGEARAARVAALRAAVASGAYQPDPREIAKKILEHGL